MFCPSSVLFLFFVQQPSVFVQDWRVDLVVGVSKNLLYTVHISFLKAAVLALLDKSSKGFLLLFLADLLTRLFNSMYCIRNMSFNISYMV